METPDTFSKLHAEAQRQWPQVDVPLEAFVAHAQARGHTEPESLEAHASDFYLAFACGQSIPTALRLLEQHYLPRARDALLRRGTAHAQVDEVLQLLRERLLVGREGALPRIADYDGRGPLTAWLRTSAVRLALNSVRGVAARPPESLISGLVAPDDLELQALKGQHRDAFSEALTDAFAKMETRDRGLLRMHLLDGVTSDQLAKVHGVSRATITRWLKTARDALFELTRAGLRERLGMSEEDFAQLVPQLLSQLDLSVRRLLESSDKRPGPEKV